MAAPWRWLAFFGVVVLFVTISSIVSHYVNREARVKLLRLNFVVSMQSLLLSGSVFIWKQLVTKVLTASSDNGKPGNEGIDGNFLIQLWRAAVFLFLVLVQLSYTLSVFLVKTEPHWLSFICFCCLGAFIILLGVVVPLITVEWTINFLQRGRRDHFKKIRLNPYVRTFFITGLVTILSLMAVTRANEGPWTKHVEIPVRNLPVSMDGFRISQLSDIHLGATVGKSKLMKAVDIARLWNPDLVVITGDLVDSTVDNLRGAVEPLKDLKAEYGMYYVTGNHEYYTGNVDGWFEHLKTLGVESLHNQHVKIISKENPEDWFYVAGIDDIHADIISYTGHGMNLDEALTNIEENHAVILLVLLSLL
ncbi:transmembrane protein with metallophosphoesterase domain-like isoform X2 [Ptychodera flava]|uniref:transmembrane protein with metallophosphoesterase domain-like isoform X2 n=1 Tax=Ptychodera flava TaxID=63121 RepID=UPI00396A67EC